jgi:cytochrome c oxidase subunit 4
MKTDPEEKEHDWVHAVLVYVALMTCAGANFLIGEVSDIGNWRLYSVIIVGTIEMGIGAWYWMHLDEQRGARRAALPLALVFVALLGSLSILDLITRWPPVLPDGPSQRALPPAIPWRIGVGKPPQPLPSQVTGGPR